MRILFVSDMHIEKKELNEIYVNLLNFLSEKYEIDLILSGGDNGQEFNPEDLNVKFYSIYGNHDSTKITESEWWLPDGLHILGGVKVLAFNGIFGFREGNRKWYYRSLDDAVKIGFGYSGKRLFIFLSHEVPYGSLCGKNTQEYLGAMNFLVKKVEPLFWLNGHMHCRKPFDVYPGFIGQTTYIRVQSLADNFGAIILDIEQGGIVDIITGSVEEKSLYSVFGNSKIEWG